MLMGMLKGRDRNHKEQNKSTKMAAKLLGVAWTVVKENFY
jgi:hypothetical protein